MTRRRAGAIAAAAAGLLLGLSGAGWFPQEPVRRLIERELARALATPSETARVHLGAVHVVPALLRADFEDLSLASAGYRLTVARLRVCFSPGILLGHVVLTSLEVEAPRLDLWETPQVGSSAGRGAATRPWPRVARVLVTRGAVSYRLQSLSGRVALRGIEARGDMGAGRLTVQTAGGVWERPTPVVLGPARAEIALSASGDLRLKAVEVRTRGSRLQAEGPLGRLGGLRLDLRWAAQIDLGEVGAVAETISMSGLLSGEGRLSGDLGSLQGEGSFSGRNLVTGGWAIDRARLRLLSKAARREAALDLAALGGSARGALRLDGSRAEARIQVEGVDLALLIEDLAGESTGISGTLGGEIDLRGDTGDPLETQGRLVADARTPTQRWLVGSRFSGPVDLAKPGFALNWTAEAVVGRRAAPQGPGWPVGRLQAHGTARGPQIDVRGTIEAGATLGLPSGPHDLALSGSLRHGMGETRIELAGPALGGTLAASASLGGERALLRLAADGLGLQALRPDLAGNAQVRFEASGAWRRLKGHGEARIDGLVFREMPLGAATASVTTEGQNGDLSWEAEELGASGSAHFDSSGIRGTVFLAQSPIERLGWVLPGKTPLAGVVSGEIAIDLPFGREIAVDARVAALEAHVGRVSASTARPFSLAVRGSYVRLEDLLMEGPGLRLELTGQLGSEAPTAGRLRATGWLDLSRVPVPEGWALSGALHGDVNLGGNLDRPAVTGVLTGERIKIEPPGAPAVEASRMALDLAGDEVRIPGLDASTAGGSVHLAGHIPFAALFPRLRADPSRIEERDAARLDFEWTGLRTEALLRAWRPNLAQGWTGPLHGRGHISGGFAAIEEVEALVEAAETRLSTEDLALVVSPFAVRIERGRVVADHIQIAHQAGGFSLGGAVDLDHRTLDLWGRGLMRLRALSPFLTDASVTGSAETDLTVTGSFDAPLPRGTLRISEGSLRLRDLPQAMTDIQGTLRFDGTAVRIEEASAGLGGGSLSLTGHAALSQKGLSDLALEIAGWEILLQYPEGLRSRVYADLHLTGQPGALLLSGEVRALRGLYDLEAAIQESLLTAVASTSPSPLLRSVGLDIRLETENPVVVRSALAQGVRASGTLAIRGDLESPTPFGRLEIVPGGKLLLQGREFTVESGRLVYGGSWDPDVALEATAAQIRAGDGFTTYRVTAKAEGSLEEPRLSFRSLPALSEGQIMNLLATGRTDSQALTSGAWMAGEQAATLLTSRFAQDLSKGLTGLGIDEVSVRPELLARETDPGARFTFGKRLGPRSRLLYSLSLKGPEERFYQLEAEPGWGVELMGQGRNDGTFTLGAGQRLRLGGRPARPQSPDEQEFALTDVRFDGGGPAISEASLRDGLRAQPGHRITAWELQDDAEHLRETLRRQGFLEAEAGARLQGTTAVFALRPGPRFVWRVEGMRSPPDLGPSIHSALFEEEALDRGRERILDALHRQGFARAAVQAEVLEQAGGRTLVFHVDKGPKLAVEVRFPGARALSRKRLLEAAGGVAGLLASPERAVERIRDAYREAALLGVEVAPPLVRQEPARVWVLVPIVEGSRARLARVRFEGATLPIEDLERAAGLSIAEPYREGDVFAAARRLREHYFSQGYPFVRVVPRVEPVAGDVEACFEIAEGKRLTVGAVEIAGLGRTDESLVRRRLRVGPGEPLDPRELVRGERRVLDLGAFATAAATFTPEDPTTVRLTVEEEAPLIGRYQFRYNDQRGASGELEAELRNLFGRGLALAGRYGRGADAEEIRGTAHAPSGFGAGDLTLSLSRVLERFPGVDPFTGLSVENTRVQRQVHLQQRLGPWRGWNLLLGYRFERTTLPPVFPDPVDVAGLTASLYSDTRDNLLDSRRGRFLSFNLDLAPQRLGSDFTFTKAYAQAFLSRPLASQLTWAQGFRLGLGWGFEGQRIRATERFRAGGGGSVRGFETDSLGPTDFLGDPEGGESVLILNQELRYHHPSGVGGVVFYDAGNVFARASEVGLDLRHSLGVGLRWKSAMGLLRLDLGLPLDRREGEKPYRLFFSLGQAF